MSGWYRGWRMRKRPSRVRFVLVPSGRTTLFASGLRATHPVVVELQEPAL